MYGDLLLPTDGSAHATAAADHALALARAFDATVHVLGVADLDQAAGLFDAGGVDEEFVERVEREAEEAVEETASRVDAASRVETAVRDGDAGETIVDYATERGLDAVVMGTHGRQGLRRFVAGSVTEHVVRTSTVPVFTVRRPDDADGGEDAQDSERSRTVSPPTYERVLLPTDGSDTAEGAVDHAVAIADAFDGELHALSVVDVSSSGATPDVVPSESVIEGLTEQGEQAVEAVADRAEDAGVTTRTAVVRGFPARTVLEYADEHAADVVVMGTHGRTGLGRVLLGSTAERVLRQAEMPVCAVPAEDRRAAMEESTDGNDGDEEGGLL